jgi:DUF4097 and DUF4098 domain-containing protein YvlB
MLGSFLAVTALALAAPQQMDSTFDVGGARRLHVENHNGSVVVRSWNRSEMRVRARHGGGTRVDINRSTSAVTIELESRRGRPGSAELELTVPQQFAIEIEGLNTAIDVNGIEGGVELETINGNITVQNANGRLDMASISGRITIRDSRGLLSAEGTNHGIDVDGFDGNVSIATVNGSLSMSGIRADRVEAETINGRIEYQGDLRENGRYELSTHNGEVVLYVPDGTNASVSVSTHNGEIDSSFPVQLSEARGRSRANFNIGSGRGARIEITSFGGPVRIRRPSER